MGFCDDPSHHWIRDSWRDQTQDSRCPMTSISGRNTK
jgi:5-deoxy-glucuronate isomerase